MSHSALTAGVRCLRDRLASQRDAQESDEQLLHAFTEGRDVNAFAALVHRHGPMVLHVCRRVLGHQQDAEDAFQATFLVLARNAATLRKKTALAGFLHGAAYRLALSAKRAAARRRKHEGRTPTRAPDDPSNELLWREVRTLLDEEIARLPEIYRSAFVLVCLEGLNQAEAARRLGVKEGTVSSRLTEARQRLQRRLSRRGVELTALLAATALATETASALPVGLLAKTSGGAASPAVAALADSSSMLLSLSKAKLATVFVLAASVLTGAGLWAYRDPSSPPSQASGSPAAKAGDKPQAAPPKREALKGMEIQGRVLDPEGKPKAGAKLLLLGEGGKIKQLGVTAADGRFTVAVPTKEVEDRYLIAQVDGFGIDFLGLFKGAPKKPVEFRVVKDRAIRGRVVNTEGKPVAGVCVAVKSVNIYSNNSLDSFLAAWKNRHHMSGIPGGEKHLWTDPAALLPATTDAEGRFVLHGVGKERLAALRLSGAGIADMERWVVNRDGFDSKPYNQATLDNSPKGQKRWATRWLLHGSEVSIVVEAEKPLHGSVKDADSGKGRSGVVVRLTRIDNSDLVSPIVQAKTDDQGRYEIRGVRKSARYMLEVASDAGMGYMACQFWAADTPGYQPVRADIAVKKGVVLTGKVIDKATGKAIPGFVMAAVLSGNPFVKEYPEFAQSAFFRTWETGAEGGFRVVALPGPVLLMGGPDDRRLPGGNLETMKYKQPVADEKYPQYFRKFGDHTAYYGVRGFSPLQGNFCKVLDIKPGTTVIEHDIVLERANFLAVKIQDVEGRPLRGVWATGISAWNGERAIRLKDDSGSAYDVQPGKPRRMVFYEPSKKLAGSVTLKGDEKPPVLVKLAPLGALKARLLDADGKPLAGVVVDVRYRERQAEEIDRVIHEAKQIVTGANGSFTLDELIPDLKFDLSFRLGKQKFEYETKPTEATIYVKPGERRDLGAIKLKRVAERVGE